MALGTAISRPLTRVAGALTAIGRGEADAETVVLPVGGPRELRAITGAAIAFRESVAERRAARAAQERMASEHAAAQHEAALLLADDFEGKVGGIVEAVSAAASQLESSANGMAQAARDTTNLTRAVASASASAAGTADAVAAATEELSVSVREIASQVGSSADLAARAQRNADGVTEEVRRLAEAASNIGEIVGMISNVAPDEPSGAECHHRGRTRGRGGAGLRRGRGGGERARRPNHPRHRGHHRQGRGDLERDDDASVRSIGGIATMVRDLARIGSDIAAMVEEQGAATAEIARTTVQTSQDTRAVSGHVAGVDTAAATASHGSDQVLAAAGDLSRQAGALRGAVAGFLSQVRAA